MKIDLAPSFKGRVRIEKGTEKDGITQTMEFDNVFLVSGIRDISKRIVEPAPSSGDHGEKNLRLFLGTGTTLPTMYDLGLEARSQTLAGRAYNSSYTKSNSDRLNVELGNGKVVVSSWELVYRYGQGQAAGVWTEIGLGSADYSVAHTRALLKNEEGIPAELTVLQDEFLAVYYTIEIATHQYYDLGVMDLNGNQHQVYYFNRRESFLAYKNYSPKNFGWGYSTTDGKLNYVRRNDIGDPTFDPVTGVYSFSQSTSNGRNPALSGFQSSLDLDSFGFKWSAQYGPHTSNTTIPLLWTESGDNGVIFFDPPIVVPVNHRIYFNFHTRIKPENYDKTMDPTYDPDFDPELPGNQ